eukprot:jgi/Ulvmu1/3822/UM018_0033.1
MTSDASPPEQADVETKQQLVAIVEQATTEADVISWMSANKVPRAQLGARNTDGSTALISACRRGMAEVAKSLLAVNAPAQDVNDLGDSALHWACFRASEVDAMVEVVEQLLAAGADPSAVGDRGNTPLHLAAACRSPMAIQLLIMYGADSTVQNCYMQTARYLALSDECLELFDLLERDGELCRQDLRARLEDDRAEAAARKEERAAEQERLKEEKRQAINAAMERRAAEDAEADARAAVDARRRREEQERRLKDADEKLRAQEEFNVWLQAEIKKNKKAKAAK